MNVPDEFDSLSSTAQRAKGRFQMSRNKARQAEPAVAGVLGAIPPPC